MTRSKQILILLVSLVALAAIAPAASSAMTPKPRGYAEPAGFKWGSQPDFRHIRLGSPKPNGFRMGSVKPNGETDGVRVKLGRRIAPKARWIRY